MHATTVFINIYWRSVGKSDVCEYTVYTSSKRLRPLTTTIAPRKQGSLNVDSPWEKARDNWCKQLLIRLRIKTAVELFKDGAPIPFPFSSEFLRGKYLKIEQIAFWDETHKKVHMGKGSAKGKKEEVRFPRDINGKLDLLNGE